MEQAESVEDIIKIESRLSEVRYQIESMEAQLRTFDNKIDYSTVCLGIDEVERYSPPESASTGARIRRGFLESVENILYEIQYAAIWLVINIPYGIVWVITIVIVIIILRILVKVWKKRAAKRTARRGRRSSACDPRDPYAPYDPNAYGMSNVQGTGSGRQEKPDTDRPGQNG